MEGNEITVLLTDEMLEWLQDAATLIDATPELVAGAILHGIMRDLKDGRDVPRIVSDGC